MQTQQQQQLIVETRILRDVFKPSDLDGCSSWDRSAKCNFLQRLIDYAANNKQPVASLIASRLLAGLEPNKTNELLQSLGRIAQLKVGERQQRRRAQTFIIKSSQVQAERSLATRTEHANNSKLSTDSPQARLSDGHLMEVETTREELSATAESHLLHLSASTVSNQPPKLPSSKPKGVNELRADLQLLSSTLLQIRQANHLLRMSLANYN